MRDRTATAADDVLSDWYNQHFERLVRLARCMLGGSAGAEDIAQEALVRAWQRFGTLVDGEPIGAWLTTVARNLCIDELRRSRDITPLDRVGEPAAPGIDLEADGDDVRRAMARITPRHREALYMHDCGRLGYGDLAERMGIRETAARMVVVRARRALRAQLESTLAASA